MTTRIFHPMQWERGIQERDSRGGVRRSEQHTRWVTSEEEAAVTQAGGGKGLRESLAACTQG